MLSHVGIWRALLESSVAFALVLEDDAWFEPGAPVLIQKVLRHLPSDWDAVFLGLHLKGSYAHIGGGLVRLSGRFWGTHAYIASRNFAQKMLEGIFPLRYQADAHIGVRLALGRANVNVYALDPAPCVQWGGTGNCQVGEDDSEITFCPCGPVGSDAWLHEGCGSQDADKVVDSDVGGRWVSSRCGYDALDALRRWALDRIFNEESTQQA
eukprot:gnl/MRDRNA2_/MRDRNA2_68763_c0_seq1.p1 gnl/MRDRNA2_/MRDRNA2_68763_c0~~gnl/MRDRNA2_/MRDRNA2_68763_c0_seq1.p1  ORF type:complete len:210 (+),score=36.52 gnl/MRDRNA2_/MRDRNA2_68763_c0_seq1:620-1249(+)